MCALSGKSPLPQTFSGCSYDPTYPDYLTSGCGISLLGQCCWTTLLTPVLLSKCAFGAVSWELTVMVLGDLVSCESFLILQEAQPGFVLPRADLNSAEWQSRAEAKVLGLPCSVVSRFAGSLPQGYRGRRTFMYLVLLCCFLTKEKDSQLSPLFLFQRGQQLWQPAVAVQRRLQDSCWVITPPSSAEAMGLGDSACLFSLLPLQGRECLTLVVYTAPSTMSALHIN